MSPEDEKLVRDAMNRANAALTNPRDVPALCDLVERQEAEIERLSSALESEQALVKSILNTRPHDDLVAKLTADRDESHRDHEACKALVRDLGTEVERLRAELAETRARLKPYTDAELDRVRDL